MSSLAGLGLGPYYGPGLDLSPGHSFNPGPGHALGPGRPGKPWLSGLRERRSRG